MGHVKKSHQNIIFILCILLISVIYNYHSIIDLPPFSIHQWRQTDCTAFAINYWKRNLPFHEPAILNAGRTGDGKIATEFPIIYYVVGKLWSVFGQHHYFFRLINIFIVFAGLLYLFKFAKLFFDNAFWSALIPILLFTSPGLVYYTNNFLPDAPAFGIVLIGLFHFGKFYKQRESKYLLWSMLFFAFAGLLKITALISYVAILGLFIFELLNFLKKEEKIFFKPAKHSIYFLLVLVLVPLWYYYAHWYNELNNKEFFLLNIKPVWNMQPEQISAITRTIYFNTLSSFFNRIVIFCILSLFVFNLILYKKADKILLILSILTFIGAIIYLSLFFQQFNVHDYYFINLLLFPIFILLTTFKIIKDHFSSLLNKRMFKAIFGIVLIALIYQTSGVQRLKYSINDKFGDSNILLTKREKNTAKWFVEYTKETYGPLEGITPYLRSLGIKRNDLVLSVPDFSYNISLYFMDQMGFTKTTFLEIPLNEKMDKFLQLGVKFLIVHEESAKDWDWIKPYLKKRIGVYKQIEIYDLKEL